VTTGRGARAAVSTEAAATVRVNGTSPEPQPWLSRPIKAFERVIVTALVVMLMAVVALSTLDVGWILVRDVAPSPRGVLQVEDVLDIFGFFLLVLIGLELLETITTYLQDRVAHVDVVLEVALVAIARKVIALDLSKYPGGTVVGLATLIVALAVAFLIVHRVRVGSRR
jgi:uncharacterized membrane protein (DUF373 family)